MIVVYSATIELRKLRHLYVLVWYSYKQGKKGQCTSNKYQQINSINFLNYLGLALKLYLPCLLCSLSSVYRAVKYFEIWKSMIKKS